MECLKVENLFKKYYLGQDNQNHSSLRDMIVSGIGKAAFWKQQPTKNDDLKGSEFYAVNDVTFSLTQGSALGIVGRNGAGKSTLLKILSRITSPTKGKITIKGRVSSLLEVGTGFHPELTGRENIFFNGVILGMKRYEIVQKFDEIVAFAGVGAFLDTPVKRYSSGMLLKLAFSVAAFLDPEILILDEVLAVGDVEFQNKCFKLISELGISGKTILFVSHNIGAVRKLCNKAILLSKGKLVKEGGVNDVLDTYLMEGKKVRSCIEWNINEAPQDDLVLISKAQATDIHGISKEAFNIHEDIYLTVTYQVKKGGHLIGAVFHFYNTDGVWLFSAMDNAQTQWQGIMREPGTYQSTCVVPRDFLNTGEITVGVHLDEAEIKPLVHLHNAISFYVVEDARKEGAHGDYVWEWPHKTAVRPALKWKTDYYR